MENLRHLVERLRHSSDESGWFEFKHNNYDPMMIGEDISALANTAALLEKHNAYMIWGINDKTHDIVGTEYDLQSLKKGNQEIENWLRYLLSQNADFIFEPVDMEDSEGQLVRIGVLTIKPAINRPVKFEKTEYIRVGSYTKKLHDFPELECRLWDRLRNTDFESQTAMRECTLPEALNHLDVNAYYNSLKKPMPLSIDAVAHDFKEDCIMVLEDTGLWSITNLGALLLARKLSDFKHLQRMALRVIQHKGTTRLHMLKEETFDEGYAVCFSKVERYLKALLPSEERINEDGRRQTVSSFPMLAIREAIGNMCIHQDLLAKGCTLLIEVFDNRIEFTNPGRLLVDVMRIVDNPPRSRNEKVAALMRRFNICEEAGTGWDKMVVECELMNLPSPKLVRYEDNTKVVIWNKKPFASISTEDKMWACYLHSCVKYLMGEQCTNASLRKRFGLEVTQKAPISRLIKKCVENNLIKVFDATVAPKYLSYVPIWV